MLKVATLVAKHFVGPNTKGFDVCHNDGDKTNNYFKNLRYDTRKGNMADCLKHGTVSCGEKHWCSKLTDALVMKIISDPRTCVQIAAEANVSFQTISDIKTGNTWKHVHRKILTHAGAIDG